MAEKRHCNKCNKTKSLSEFHKQADGPFRRRTNCKSCIKIMDRERYAKFKKNKPQKESPADKKTHRCATCRAVKLKKDFYVCNKNAAKIQYSCKDCVSKKRKKGLEQEKRRQLNLKISWCKVCDTNKPLSAFNPSKKTIRGVQGECKSCRILIEKERKQRVKEYKKEWKKINQKRLSKKRRDRENQRRISDPIFKAKNNISRNIRNALEKRNTIKDCKTTEILGCSALEFWNHLCGTFEENYGFPREWITSFNYQIDHIIPLSIARTKKDIYELNHHTNLQILLKEDNHKKSNNLGWELI
jgi:hypothetical protein